MTAARLCLLVQLLSKLVADGVNLEISHPRPIDDYALIAFPSTEPAAGSLPEVAIDIEHWFERTGNNLLQLVNGILAGEILAMKQGANVTLRLPAVGPPQEGLARLFDLPRSISVAPDASMENAECQRDDEHGLSLYYFQVCSGVGREHVRSIMRRYLRPHLKPEVQLSCSGSGFPGLTVHLRSGDLLTNLHLPQSHFFPCAYIEGVIRQNNFSSVLIVTENDRSHPCLEELPKRLPEVTLTVQSKSIEEDACALLTAHYAIAGAWSTFSQMLFLLNDNLKVGFEARENCNCEGSTWTNSTARQIHCYEAPRSGDGSLESKLDFLRSTPASSVASKCKYDEGAEEFQHLRRMFGSLVYDH